MNRLLRNVLATAILAAFLTAPLAAPVLADTFSVSVDVPVNYSFDNEQLSDAKASGAMVGVTLPFLLGFGYESYKVTGTAGTVLAPAVSPLTANTDYEYKVSMVNVYWDAPVPVINLRLGAGVGKGDLQQGGASVLTDDAKLTQLFFNIGVPFAGVFDAHVGYHKISGDGDDKVNLGQKVNLDSGMATIGLKMGF